MGVGGGGERVSCVCLRERERERELGERENDKYMSYMHEREIYIERE